MHYLVYKTTNMINGRWYIGKHKTEDVNDGYLGSGKLLNAAIKKHGKENFLKEILFELETEEEMNAKEAELVTEEVTKADDNYNLCPGGHGGWGYINSNGKNGTTVGRKLGGQNSPSWVNAHSEVANAKRLATERKKGSAFLKERALKASIAAAKVNTGTMWITNGSTSKKIGRDSTIPEGWKKGRTGNFTNKKYLLHD